MSIDTSEVDALALRLATAPARLPALLMPVANRAGTGIKKVMKADASGHQFLRGLPRHVSHEVTVTPKGVQVEVGFNKHGQGSLANIAAFGTSKNPPVMDITRGLTVEVPGFVRECIKAAVKAPST